MRRLYLKAVEDVWTVMPPQQTANYTSTIKAQEINTVLHVHRVVVLARKTLNTLELDLNMPSRHGRGKLGMLHKVWTDLRRRLR